MHEFAHEFARLINTAARTDTSGPPCWTTDEALKAVEAVVIRQDGQPGQFAAICRSALDGVEDPYIRALINLGVLNGARRPDDADVATVNELFQTCQDEITSLNPNPRKARLENFVRYQGRVFLARNGYYEQAAQLEKEEVAASVREAERSVSRFLAQLYRIWNLISIGDTRVMEECDELYHRLVTMQTETAGTNLETLWSLGNGPIHTLQVLLLADQMNNWIWRECLNAVRQHHDQLSLALQTWATVFKAANLLSCGDRTMASESLASLPDDASPDIKAAAKLVQARIMYAKYNLCAAREIYLTIKPVPHGHMIAAVAARELAGLPSA